MKHRSSGVLLHIASLPGPCGIGSFGKEAVEFAALLKKMGFSYWQTLPFTTTDEFNSPYTSFSAFAGNPYFVDLPTLQKEGLITAEELEENTYHSPYAVDYKWLWDTRMPLLRRAASRVTSALREKIVAFSKENAFWLPDFALYMALKDAHGQKDWPEWEPELRARQPEALERARQELADDIAFYEFVQYEFYTQWAAVKAEINRIGIQIIGDMPIYLCLRSSDVWSNQQLFDLDEDGAPRHVAGCPPDYFAADGQFWGNPIYNWKVMKATGYHWWLQRIAASLELYDMVRIDHFRAFSAYWSIPATAKTAKEGSWVKGPGMDFFEHVFRRFKDPQIIAEDLGEIDDDVRKLMADTGLPGMRVLQFAFIDNADNLHLPHNIPKNTLAYTGTHDNDTTLGWFYNAQQWQRENAMKYCGFEGDWHEGGAKSPICRAMIRTLWQSAAQVAILPIQDLCGYGSDTRMNQPGVADGNWGFRVTEEALRQLDTGWMLETNRTFRRSST